MVISTLVAAAFFSFARGDDFVDCVGQKLTDEDCTWVEGGYRKCSDWLGDGSCDDGLVVTDNWTQMYLNCAKFEFDKGDCEKDADDSVGVCSSDLEEDVEECEAPGDDEIVDCWGQVLSDEDCVFEYTDDDGKEHKYEKCEDWLGDGSCDAGQFVSIEGFHINFNCQAFDYDGGDCDAPEGGTPAPTVSRTPEPTDKPEGTPAPTKEERTPAPTKESNQGTLPVEADTEAMDAIWSALKMMKIFNKRYNKVKWNGCYDEDGDNPVDFISHYMKDGQKDAGVAFAKCKTIDDELRVTEIHVKGFGGELKKWKGKGNLQKLKHLELVNLSGNQLKKFKAEFKDMPQLKSIIFSENVVRRLDKAWLEGTTNIEEIVMDKNKMRGLKSTSFQNLSKLKILNVESNGLKKVPPTLLKDNVALEELFIAGNNWGKVKEETFANQKHLKIIDMKDNSIKVLPTKLFLKLGSIEEIHLGGNKLKCKPPLPNDSDHRPQEWSEDGKFSMDNASKLDDCDFEPCTKLKDSGKTDFCKTIGKKDRCSEAKGQCDKTCTCCDMDGAKVCASMTNKGKDCDSKIMTHIYAGVCRKTCGFC